MRRKRGWWGRSRAGQANSSVIKFLLSAHLLFAHGTLSPAGGPPLTTRTAFPAETTRIRRVFDLNHAEARRRQENSGARAGLDEPPAGHAAGERAPCAKRRWADKRNFITLLFARRIGMKPFKNGAFAFTREKNHNHLPGLAQISQKRRNPRSGIRAAEFLCSEAHGRSPRRPFWVPLKGRRILGRPAKRRTKKILFFLCRFARCSVEFKLCYCALVNCPG